MKIPACDLKLYKRFNSEAAKARRDDRKRASQEADDIEAFVHAVDVGQHSKLARLETLEANLLQTSRRHITEMHSHFRGHAYRRTISSPDWKGNAIWNAPPPITKYLYVRCNTKEMQAIKSQAEAVDQHELGWRVVSRLIFHLDRPHCSL